ncbi:SPW repeat protein [Brachybacterium huguangmaarense]|uniref:SPW repeat protein n=1 Tax=Brachybacterium huguangmaarense TaxID=1652028 RepID=A0ABY6G361_9MICO|nr:SPW repeat protein [Brachybacterium huguangmaarense]UYG17658.1 SPW repeat protein [Brachybacterium huguangmaarense]
MTETSQTTDAAVQTAPAPAVPQPLNTLDKVGMGILTLLTLSGLWMIVAPFLVGYQARTSDWAAGTTNDVVVGITLVVLSLVALVVLFGGALGELARNARRRMSVQA